MDYNGGLYSVDYYYYCLTHDVATFSALSWTLQINNKFSVKNIASDALILSLEVT